MFPYFVTFSISLLFVGIAEKYGKTKKRIISFLCLLFVCICLSLLASSRAEFIGTDLRTYVIRHYSVALNSNSFSSFRLAIADESVEILYAVMCWVISRITHNVRVWLFIIEFWDISFLLAFIWKQRDRFSVVMGAFVVMMLYYNVSLNLVRQMMALSVCVYAWLYARDRNLKKFIFMMIIAAMIHVSSLVMVITYPLCRIFEKKKSNTIDLYIYGIAILSIGILVAINPILFILIKIGFFPIKFSHYIGGVFAISRVSAFIFVFPSLLIYFFYRKKLYKSDVLNPVLFCYIILWPIFAQLDSVSDQLGRLSLGFLLANIAIFAQVPKLPKLKKNGIDRKLITIASVVFLLFYWFLNFYVWKVGETVPYVWGL